MDKSFGVTFYCAKCQKELPERDIEALPIYDLQACFEVRCHGEHRIVKIPVVRALLGSTRVAVFDD